MTYTKETGKKWENENGKTSHMKVSMVHDAEECEKECTAAAPCIAFTFIPGMEICALKAPKDALTLVPAGGEMISRKAGWGKAKCSWKRVGIHHLPLLPSRFICTTFDD